MERQYMIPPESLRYSNPAVFENWLDYEWEDRMRVTQAIEQKESAAAAKAQQEHAAKQFTGNRRERRRQQALFRKRLARK